MGGIHLLRAMGGVHLDRILVAQLVLHWDVIWEVVSSTPAGPTLRVSKQLSSRIRTINRMSHLTDTFHVNFISSMWDVKEPTHYSKRVGHEVPDVVAVLCEWVQCR